MNHGLLGSDILQQHNRLSSLTPTQQEVVLKSIRHHNASALPEHESPGILRFARMIRDADKIDIFQLSIDYFSKRTEKNKNTALEFNLPDLCRISDRIYDHIMREELALMKDIETLDDFKAVQISWIFDVNYQQSFEVIDNMQILQRLYDTFSKKDQRPRDIYKKARYFLKQKVDPVASAG